MIVVRRRVVCLVYPVLFPRPTGLAQAISPYIYPISDAYAAEEKSNGPCGPPPGRGKLLDEICVLRVALLDGSGEYGRANLSDHSLRA